MLVISEVIMMTRQAAIRSKLRYESPILPGALKLHLYLGIWLQFMIGETIQFSLSRQNTSFFERYLNLLSRIPYLPPNRLHYHLNVFETSRLDIF